MSFRNPRSYTDPELICRLEQSSEIAQFHISSPPLEVSALLMEAARRLRMNPEDRRFDAMMTEKMGRERTRFANDDRKYLDIEGD